MATAPILQAAVVPVRAGRICLITSRRNKRWIIPKGCLEAGKPTGQVALQEAWEEAGLVGVLHPEPIGTFLYQKWGRTHHVTVFLMRVTEVHEDWPERVQRRRRWLSPAKALARLDDPGLIAMIRGLMAEDRIATPVSGSA